MKEFINSLTGTRMLVADDREEEYRAAGHRLVVTDEQADGPDDPPEEHTETKSGEEKAPNAEPAASSEPAAAQSPAAKKRTAAPKRKAAAKK